MNRATNGSALERQRVSRRGLLAIGLAGAAALVGGIAAEYWRALHRQPYPYNAELSATATAASRKGLETTLEPDVPFTAEMIQEVRNNAVIIAIRHVNGRQTIASAWLAQGLGEGTSIVTAAHHFGGDASDIADVSYGRPYIDASLTVVDASQLSVALGGSKEIPQDVALIYIPHAALPPSAHGFPFKDDYPPKIGEEMLFAGYPRAFQNSDDPLSSITQGGVIPVSQIDSVYTWEMPGLAGIGSSGGPVCVVADGQLIAVGETDQAEVFYKGIVVSSLPLRKLRDSIAA